jgi:hypothetical protein
VTDNEHPGHTTCVTTTAGREHQFRNARFVIHSDEGDLSIYRPTGSEMWAGFARGQWASVHNDHDQPEPSTDREGSGA